MRFVFLFFLILFPATYAGRTCADATTPAVRDGFPLDEQVQLQAEGTFTVLTSMARRHEYGRVVLVADQRDAVSSAGPLLSLRKLLADNGWSCWVLLREPLDEKFLQSRIEKTLALARSATSPGPTKTPQSNGKPALFLLLQGDSATRISDAQNSALQGLILLTASQAGTAPTGSVPMLDVIAEQDFRLRRAEAKWRAGHWSVSPLFEQRRIPASTAINTNAQWLSHVLAGWMQRHARGTAAAPVTPPQ